MRRPGRGGRDYVPLVGLGVRPWALWLVWVSHGPAPVGHSPVHRAQRGRPGAGRRRHRGGKSPHDAERPERPCGAGPPRGEKRIGREWRPDRSAADVARELPPVGRRYCLVAVVYLAGHR